jgi:NodT family efflux transporter outer membrane factor (OMF) lipoprotein
VPDDRRPDPTIPSAWSDATNRGLQDAVAVRSGWWRSFGSNELSTLERRGLTENYNLKAAIARIEEARGTAQIAGAPLYPALSLNGALDRSNGKGTDLKTSRTQSLFGLATYEVDFWGKNRANADSAQSLAAASQFDSDTVAMTLAASVADTYFLVLSLRQRIRLAKTIARDAARVLSLIEARLSVGTAAEVDVAQQRNAVATFNAAVPLLQQQLEQSLHLLAVLVGDIPENLTLEARSLDDIVVPPVKADLPSVVLRQRPDIGAAEARLVADNFNVGAARAAFYPGLNLTAAGGIASPSFSHFFPERRGCRISAERFCSRCFPVANSRASCGSAARKSSSSPPSIARPSSLLCRTSRIRSAPLRRSSNWNRPLRRRPMRHAMRRTSLLSSFNSAPPIS